MASSAHSMKYFKRITAGWWYIGNGSELVIPIHTPWVLDPIIRADEIFCERKVPAERVVRFIDDLIELPTYNVPLQTGTITSQMQRGAQKISWEELETEERDIARQMGLMNYTPRGVLSVGHFAAYLARDFKKEKKPKIEKYKGPTKLLLTENPFLLLGD